MLKLIKLFFDQSIERAIVAINFYNVFLTFSEPRELEIKSITSDIRRQRAIENFQFVIVYSVLQNQVWYV